MKIYSDDPNLPYKTTKLKALYTKSEIEGLFAKWGVKDVYWHWDLSNFGFDTMGGKSEYSIWELGSNLSLSPCFCVDP